MRPAGGNDLALWREAGAWWASEPCREVRQFIDPKGVKRQEEQLLPSLGINRHTAKDYVEDHTEEHSVRIRKLRDEKVARAMGYYYESYRGTVRGERKREAKREQSQVVPTDAESLRLASFATNLTHAPASAPPYAVLHAQSGYAFGRSTMLAEEIPILCAQHEIPAAAIADPFSLTGAVEFVRMAKKVGVKPLVGASFEMAEGGELVLIAKNPAGYKSLSRLITACHLNEPRLFPLCTWERLEQHAQGLICLTGGDGSPVNRLLVQRDVLGARRLFERLILLYGRDGVFVEIERNYVPWELSVNRQLLELAREFRLLPIAGGMVTHAKREHFPVQDVVVCAQTLCTVDEIIGRKPHRDPTQPRATRYPERAMNGERFLHDRQEMAGLFADAPDLLTNSLQVAEICEADVLPKRTELPGVFADDAVALRELTYAGAHERHRTISPKLRRRLDLEIERIIRLNFASHFLTIWDACNWARSQHILFSGRGSVVDSAVAYCLGLSRIDGFAHNLHFDRFLPQDGSKRPDIDIDFEANHRDDIRNYFERKYGSERVATVAAVGAYCTRGIIREVGKALGLSPEDISFLAKRIHGGVSPDHLEKALEKRPELRNSNVPKERFRWVFALAERLMDVPRNIRAHSSGVIISAEPLAETVPVTWSASAENNGGLWDSGSPSSKHLRIIQWDKRSAKHYFDKFDVLCLRGQDVLSGTEERIRIADSSFAVEQIPLDDEETYRAMRSGELIGIPQSASPAMRQAHIRLRTADLHDASLVQAGIRPGVGGAVKINELIARRRGAVQYSFSHPELERILGISYGIIVFQEQVDQLLQSFCGYTSGEAEDIREAIHQRRRESYAESIRAQIIDRIISQGYNRRLADEVYDYISGFQGYGFAQGHALAFAEISIRSIYCQQNFPAEYFAALLSAQPAGYYGPCTLVNEARIRGASILPPCVNRSVEQFSVEDVQSATDPKLVFPNGGIRIGLMQVAGLSRATRRRIQEHTYRSFFHFVVRAEPERDELEALILCGAVDGLCPNRRAMLWAIPAAQAYAASRRSLTPDCLPLELVEPELNDAIADFSQTERAIHERRILGLDIERHLMIYERERVAAKGAVEGSVAKNLESGRKAIVVGNPIRLRFPPTKSGKRVVFFDLEDETGLLNVTCFDDVYQKDGHAIICSPYVTVIGEAQDRDGHTAFLAHRIFAYRPRLAGRAMETAALPVATADFLAK